MADWVVLHEGVSWKSPPLFFFRSSRDELARVFGPASIVDADSNGLGLFDAWAIRFPCGLEACLWLFHDEPPGSERPLIEVHANFAHERHLRFHLPLHLDDVSYSEPSQLEAEPLVWRVVRQDDHGVRVEMASYSSRCEATAVAESFERRGHKQTYWVEEA